MFIGLESKKYSNVSPFIMIVSPSWLMPFDSHFGAGCANSSIFGTLTFPLDFAENLVPTYWNPRGELIMFSSFKIVFIDKRIIDFSVN